MREYEVSINDKKSTGYCVRGIITVDGIGVPFTAYRVISGPSPATGQWDATVRHDKVCLRSKRGILKTFNEGDLIASKVKDKARGWWIDHNYWR